MPRMDGRALSERLRAARPDLRVLFVSGYAGHALTDGLLEQSGVALLRKVFTPAQLIEAVGALLDAPPTAAVG